MHRGRVVEQGPTGDSPRPPPRAVHAAAARERAAARMEADARRARPDPKERPRDLLAHPRPRQRPRPHAGPRRARRRPRSPCAGERDRRGRRRRRGPRAGAARPRSSTSRGAAVMPGIIDSHLHPFLGALDARGADLMDARTLDDVRAKVAAERARCEPHQWVLGYGLDYNVFADTGISGDLIADAAGGGPAIMTFIDFHTALATPPGARDRRRRRRPRVHRARRGRRRRGRRPDRRAARDERDAARARRDARASRTPSATGTAPISCGGSPPSGSPGRTGWTARWRRSTSCASSRATATSSTRLVDAVLVAARTPEEVWEAYARHRDEAGARWRAGIAKLFIDGVIDSGTGWLVEPDSEGDGLDAVLARLRQVRPRRALLRVARLPGRHPRRGRPRRARGAQRLPQRGRRAGIRHRIEHIETIQPDDLPRFAAEGVIASMQPQHMMWLEPDRSDNWSRRLGGGERCDRAFRTARPARVRRDGHARLRLAGRALRLARGHGRRAAAPPAGFTDRAPYDDQAVDR